MIPKSEIRFSEKIMLKQKTSACRLCSRPPAHALHEAWTRWRRAGISELLRRPLISTEVASALARWLRSSDVLPL
jgi:hypothetical protein